MLRLTIWQLSGYFSKMILDLHETFQKKFILLKHQQIHVLIFCNILEWSESDWGNREPSNA